MDNLFVESTDDILKIMVDEFQNIRGEVLYDADARKMILRAVTLGIIFAGNKLNSAARNRFLKYCDEETLDLFADDKKIDKRYQAKKALTTIKFTRINSTNIQAIPYDTRVSNGQLVFIIKETKTFQIGQTDLEIQAECEEAGSFGNGYLPGTFSMLLDSIPYISGVTNTTVTNGGSDIEDVEAYRERIRIAPESYSCAGTKGAYEFWAKSAESSISDAHVYLHAPGTVGIRVLLNGGIMPSDEVLSRILDVVSSDDIRAFTDFVVTSKPTTVNYTNEFDYYIPKSQEQFTESIQKNVIKECEKWELENKNKLGIDINPDTLNARIINLGVKRIVRRTPAYTSLDKTKIAICSDRIAMYSGVEDD